MPAQQRLPDQVGPSMPSMSERKSNCSNDCNIFLLVGIYIIVGKKSQIRLRILEQIGLNKESERTDRRSES